jgi:hypothetical protein
MADLITPEMQERSRRRRWRLVSKLVDHAVELGVAAVLIAGMYVLYNLITGDFIRLPTGPSHDLVIQNAQRAANVILFGSILTSAVVIVRWGWIAAPAYAAGAWGVVLYVLAPWGLAVAVNSPGAKANEVTTVLGLTFHVTGEIVLGLVLVRLMVGGVRGVIVGRQASKAPVELTLEQEAKRERKSRGHRSLLRKCWELSMCRAEMRDYCPAFRDGKACWRKGEGCLCDPVFAQKVMETAEREQGLRVSPQEREARERMRRQTHLDTSGRARRARCRACPLYNEHQHYKYRAVFWLAYPATAAVVWVLMPYIHIGYQWLSTILYKWVSSTAILPDQESEYSPYMSISMQSKSVEFLVVLAVAFIVVSYLLELAEYFVFEVKV